MALSNDQKAILRLLSQRGAQGYEDLSALLGMSVDEVYSRAKAAAAQLESEGIPAPIVPEPGGGGAPPSAAKEGEAPPEQSPPPTVPAEPLEPAPEPPGPIAAEKSAPARVPPAPPPPKRSSRASKPKLALPKDRGARTGLLAGATVVVGLVILLATGVLGDGGGSSTASTAICSDLKEAPTPSGKAIAGLAAETIKGGGREPTRAVLRPVDGSEAAGLAVFGRVKKSLALRVVVEGLSPSKSCGYTLWIAASPTKMLPLASTEVGGDGEINSQIEVPVAILTYVADETFNQIAITRTDESELKASLAKATKEKKAPVYMGDEVLRGTVTGPLVGAAKHLKEEKGK